MCETECILFYNFICCKKYKSKKKIIHTNNMNVKENQKTELLDYPPIYQKSDKTSQHNIVNLTSYWINKDFILDPSKELFDYNESEQTDLEKALSDTNQPSNTEYESGDANTESTDAYSANIESTDAYSANIESTDAYSANIESTDAYSANIESTDAYSANTKSVNPDMDKTKLYDTSQLVLMNNSNTLIRIKASEEEINKIISNIQIITNIKKGQKLWIDADNISYDTSYLQMFSRWSYSQGKDLVSQTITKLVLRTIELIQNKESDDLYNLLIDMIDGLNIMKQTDSDYSEDMDKIINIIKSMD